MTYIPAANLDFTDGQYVPHTTLDFIRGEAPQVYPTPPRFILTSGIHSGSASLLIGKRAPQGNDQASVTYAERQTIASMQADILIDKPTNGRWNKVATKDNPPVRKPFGEGVRLDPTPERHHHDATATKDSTPQRKPWKMSIPHNQHTDTGYNNPPPKDGIETAEFVTSHPRYPVTISVPADLANDGNISLTLSPYLAGTDFELVPAGIDATGESDNTRPVYPSESAVDWSRIPHLDEGWRLPWNTGPRIGTEVPIDYGAEPDPPPLPYEPIEIKPVYIHMNSSQLVVLPAETPLSFSGLTISLDIDSSSWAMSCTILNEESMALIRPTAEGPAEVRATVNGHEWVFIVERYSTNRRFAENRYRIDGTSLTQLMAAPYAPQRTERIESPVNISQVMTKQLEFTGFGIDYQTGLPDHVIPKDAWGYEDKTPVEVIAELAESVGSVIIPAKSDKMFYIKHRYKQVSAWNFMTLDQSQIDVQLADALALSYTGNWQPGDDVNAVWVSGVIDGVSTNVIRSGTAGDKPAADDYGPLNLDPGQCRMKGMTILNGLGNIEIVTIETALPTSGPPGLIEPAMLFEYQDLQTPENSWRGMVLSNSINVSQPGAAKVIQSIQVERYHGN